MDEEQDVNYDETDSSDDEYIVVETDEYVEPGNERPTLVLDLDETLVHCDVNRMD